MDTTDAAMIHFNAIDTGSNLTGVTNPSGLTVSIAQSTCWNTFSNPLYRLAVSKVK